VFKQTCRGLQTNTPGLQQSRCAFADISRNDERKYKTDEEVAMATERQREIKRRRKRREKRLKAQTREARKRKKKR